MPVLHLHMLIYVVCFVGFMETAAPNCNLMCREAIPGIQSSNFPIHDCSTAEIDVLFLYHHPNVANDRDIFSYREKLSLQFNQPNMVNMFLYHLKSFPSNKTNRVMYVGVCDTFSIDNPDVNVRSWTLFNEIHYKPYGGDCYEGRNMPELSIQHILERKISFVQRLFSEMSGVRDNSKHIAIIFLSSTDFLYKEMRNISGIVKKSNRNIQIFVVFMGSQDDNQMIHLSDALIVPQFDRVKASHALIMAICHQCRSGWFQFNHSYTTDLLSCYKVRSTKYKKTWIESMSTCTVEQHAFLTTIETQEEKTFLQTALYSYIRDLATPVLNQNTTSQLSVQVYIGLHRDLSSFTKRFQWMLQNPSRYRPLVVNNWLHGKPSGGRMNNCGMWQFVWNQHKNDTPSNSRDDSFHEGWIDVGCRNPLSRFGLCEVILPRRLEDIQLMEIIHSSNDSYTKALNKGDFVELNHTIVSVAAHAGRIQSVNKRNISGHELYSNFDCGEDAGAPRYISYHYVCDDIDDCTNKRDEVLCKPKPSDINFWNNENNYPVFCEGVYCCDGSCLPRQYVNDGEVDCAICDENSDNIINDETKLAVYEWDKNEECAFICNVDECISFSKLNDSRIDCNGIEGSLDETLGKLERATTCYNVLEHSIWAPKCVYIKDMYGAVFGCRDMSHLKNCTYFMCPEGYSKCDRAYCIPHHYVRDGKVDCPTGEDETNYSPVECSGNFGCWESNICLHPDLVCDGRADCPRQDDELDCHVYCNTGFRCTTWRVTVTDYNSSVLLKSLDSFPRGTRYLDMSRVDLSGIEFLKNSTKLDYVVYVKLPHCNIINIQQLLPYFSRFVQILDISYNLLEIFNYTVYQYPALENIRNLNLSYNKQLINVTFSKLRILEILDLSHTRISSLDKYFLEQLPEMKYLNLSYTLICDIYKHDLSSNKIWQSLDLRGLHLKHFVEDIFNGLTIGKHLFTDSFEICCPQIRGTNIPAHTCHAPEDAVSSCFDLVGVHVQRILIWVVASLAVLGNLTVILYRVIWNREILRTGYGLFVTNLGISDLIMGVYLFIIAGADNYYRGFYVLYDKNWRESIVCKCAGFLATLSCETSTYFICLITLDRYLVMKYPFGQIHFTTKSKTICLLLSWIIGFCLALTPIVFQFEIYFSNAVCLGLPLTTQRLNGWQFSFGLFIVHNFLMFLFIAYGQKAIFSALYGNRPTEISAIKSSRRIKDIVVAKQLFLVALSNFLSWFPIGLMGLLSLGGHEISNDVYAWTTIVIIPINSAANPLLYTIPALLAKWKAFKHGDISIQSNTVT